MPPHVSVADRGENRVPGWADASSFVNGAAADIVLGQPNLTIGTLPSSPRADDMLAPIAIFVDGPGSVYLTDIGFERVVVYLKPLASGGGTPGVQGSKGRLFGQSTSTANDGCNDYGGAGAGRISQSVCSPAGLVVDGSGRLWLADGGNHRVLVFDQ